MIPYLLVFFLVLGLELAYFSLAKRFNITDTPNERSSHTRATIRGGGIVFLAAVLLFELWSGFSYPWFFVGTLLVAGISFVDDVLTLPSKVRLPFQAIGALLLILDTGAAAQPLWWFVVAVVAVVGIANVFNFMDGVNGITGLYGLVTLTTLGYLNIIDYADSRLIAFVIMSLLVFGFFNFRRRAVCFAGDVGSISLAFVILFLLCRLILATGSYYFILLLAVYGIDAGLTILQRLARRENILEAHRSHLYQWLVKPGPLTHLQAAGLYAALQAAVNVIVILTWRAEPVQQIGWGILILFSLAAAYIYVKTDYQKRYEVLNEPLQGPT